MSASLTVTVPVAFRTSSGRRPRGVVKIGGKMAAFIDFEVEQKGYFSADTFKIELEAWNQPPGYPNFEVPYWDTAKSTQVECLMGFLLPSQDVGAIPTSLTSLVYGQIDTVEVYPDKGRILLLGRDLTALLIDTRTSNNWPQQTASQIVTTLANQVGLTPQVTATTTPAGNYYNNAYAQLAREIPMWDLICFLAQNEGYDCYVQGQTLYFGPPQNQNDPNPYAVNFGKDNQGRRWSNVFDFKLERALTLAQDLVVTVKSHNYATGQVVTATAKRSGAGATQSTSAKPSATAQNYLDLTPNLTQEQAQQRAQNMLANITQFERLASGAAEGDPTLNPHTRAIRVQGTNTTWDKLYFLDFVGHKFSVDRGYGMSFRAKNHSTATQLAI